MKPIRPDRKSTPAMEAGRGAPRALRSKVPIAQRRVPTESIPGMRRTSRHAAVDRPIRAMGCPDERSHSTVHIQRREGAIIGHIHCGCRP